MNKQELFENIKKKKSFLCVGLDTDIKKIPEHLLKEEDPIFAFNKAIIDATAPYCIAYKPNLAFYESMGVKGWIAFEKTVEYIKKNYPDQFIIADAKRGDIGNTSAMYARTFFEELNIDSVTVAPYMGEDSVTPFLTYEGKWVILLALTSNKGSHDFQLTTENRSQSLLAGTGYRCSGRFTGRSLQIRYDQGMWIDCQFKPRHYLCGQNRKLCQCSCGRSQKGTAANGKRTRCYSLRNN